MTSMNSGAPEHGITLRNAALIAGFCLLVSAITSPFAEFHVSPRLMVGDDAEQVARNILAHRDLYLAGVFAYLINFVADLVDTWALYVLLRPVNAAVSLLTAWFRLVYTVISVVALQNLATVSRLLITPDDLTASSVAQVKLLLRSFRYEWELAFVFFGIHLVLLGFLVERSKYIPRTLGFLLVINGLGYLVYDVGQYVVPGKNLGFLFVTFFGELLFMLWLLIRGWKIRERSNAGGAR
jgi:hypothetical protein